MIVEVHDHKSTATTKEPSQTSGNPEKTEPASIHNYTAYLTPSPWVPFPKDNKMLPHKASKVSEDDASKPKTAAEKDKENMPAPNQPVESQRSKNPSKAAKILTVVLHPTALSQYVDLAIKATTPVVAAFSGSAGRRDSRQDHATPMSASGPRPPTPLVTVPSTPQVGMEPPAKRQKREKMELDGKNVHEVESQILLATTAPLFLDTIDSVDASARLLEALAHPEHSASVPAPNTRKKTVAEVAAEELAAKDEEQFMLTLDERLSSNKNAPGAVNTVDGEGQAGGASWEPRFERFKAIESIKVAVVEKKKLEKQHQAELAKKAQQENQEREKQKQEALKAKMEEDGRKMFQAQQEAAARQAQHQEAYRRQMASSAARAQSNSGQQHPQMGQGQNQHAHPQQNSGLQNGLTQQQHQRFMAQQQVQVSSPIVRNATPQHLSSPMVASNVGAAMQQSNSNMGGSPQRPGSVVQQGHQMTPALAHAMRAQSSQQSNAGTPRLPSATPNMAPAVPRNLSQTPRLGQSSPMPGPMIQTPQMGQQMMPNGQMANIHLQAQHLAQQQQQQQQQAALRSQAARQAMGSSPPNPQQMTQQQFLAMQQQQQLAQQQMAQQNPNLMNGNQMTNAYAAQMRALAHAQAQAQAQANGMQGQIPMQQNFMNMQGMTPQMMQQLQQHAAQQAQHQQPGGGGMHSQAAQHFANQVKTMAQRYFHAGIGQLQSNWNGQPPPEMLQQFKATCHKKAQEHVRSIMMNNQLRQQQAVATGMPPQAAAQGMNINMANMGAMPQAMQQRPQGM